MGLVRSTFRYQCTVCGHKPIIWCPVCASCKSRNSYKTLGLQYQPLGSRISVIGEREIPDEDRIDSGVPVWQKLTDGGQTFGTVILLAAGEGSGKSTLLLEVAIKSNVERTLYVTGEEQDIRIAGRAKRLDLLEMNRNTRRCRVLQTTVTEEIMDAADREHAQLIIVDSAQAFTSRFSANGKAGSVSEVKRLALRTVEHARRNNTSWVVIGQLTQDGKVAGPRKMPHWVDGVGMIRKNEKTGIRRIGFTKWRDGQTHVWYQMVMTSKGLFEADDPRVKTAVKEGEASATQQSIAAEQQMQRSRKSSRGKKVMELTEFELPSGE
jgi:DNA repair protein RadA/Sms